MRARHRRSTLIHARAWRKELTMKQIFVGLLALAGVALFTPRAAAQGICHYWSLEACDDSCERNFANDPVHYDECINLCAESCGSGDGSGGTENDDGGHSPIVIDLGNGTLRFTSAANGVLFDIDGDGQRDPIAWTEAGSPDGFLVLDRDGNGTIDSGRELFGNYTQQPTSPHPNGFLALAVFDSNSDGVISAADAVFRTLRIWTDTNHNGRSEAQELATLDSFDIVSIDLHYRTSRRHDPYGNQIRYRSRVNRDGPPTVAVDVFFRALQ
jgi:hypothetical protein